MSSVIELYEHNQKAYDALLDMLGERDRACIIKPTGTGKFVIIAKMVQDNPDKRFLLLGTNDYMFNDQMANLAEIAPGFTPENLQFMTYAAAMGMERRNDCVPPYDVIIADEFHHCGAEEWGKGVTHILNANESAKVVGFTATPIRYSDGGRNMADEMFDGNVAYSMELEEAWLRGILPIPKYVTAFYEAPEELGRLAKSIAGLKNERVMKRFQKKYEQLRRCTECQYKIGRSAKRKVVCVETGAVYKGISAAGRAIGRSAASVSHALKAGTCSGGYHWQFLDE